MYNPVQSTLQDTHKKGLIDFPLGAVVYIPSLHNYAALLCLVVDHDDFGTPIASVVGKNDRQDNFTYDYIALSALKWYLEARQVHVLNWSLYVLRDSWDGGIIGHLDSHERL